MIFELACGHVWSTRPDILLYPNEIEWCPTCQHKSKLWAVECREWKVSCTDCRMARWCGQSQSDALLRSRKHTEGHRTQVDYLMRPEKLLHLTKLYPKVNSRVLPDRGPMYVWTPPEDCPDCNKPHDECRCVPF